MIHDFGFVVLEMSPAEPQDTGKWTCRATNKNGTDEVSCDIKVRIELMAQNGQEDPTCDWLLIRLSVPEACPTNGSHQPNVKSASTSLSNGSTDRRRNSICHLLIMDHQSSRRISWIWAR